MEGDSRKKNGAEESRHKITLLPKVINRDRYNYKRTRYHLPSLNGRWPSDTQVDLVLDSGHIINQQRSPSHHLSQSFRPPSLAARQVTRFVCYVCQLGLFILRPIRGLDFGAHNGPRIRPSSELFFGKKPANIHYETFIMNITIDERRPIYCIDVTHPSLFPNHHFLCY